MVIHKLLSGMLALIICGNVVAALRDDVLIIVNDNSVDSPALGAYYAQQRGIDPANIVHVRVPAGYFISWTEFRSLRDQLIDFMQRHTLDDPALVPVVCSDGEPPYYCPASMQQLRSHSRIRYLVTTRGVPTRMVVDGSPLYDPSAPTSVDNYLKYWLVNYFAADTWLNFTQRETAFGDGRGMRTVLPATDRELIVGRIDGLSLDSARALLDRTLAAERQGLFGRLFGSTRVQRWVDYTTLRPIYPPDGTAGWPYQLGLFGEARPECLDYLGVSGLLPAGKTPAHCTVALNDDADPVTSANYPAPGNAASRQPQAVDALIYQGWLDGQAAAGSYNALLNWRKDDQCTVTECRNAADPAACRAASTDIFGELNTDCVGVAAGFMGYNHQSWPASYLAVWPTGWFQSTSNSSWNDGGHGDVNQLAFPEVRTDTGFDDNYSLWFRNSDQVTDPRCYPDSDFTAPPGRPCADQRRVVLTQRIPLAAQALDTNNPPAYQVSFSYWYENISDPVTLNVHFFAHDTGAGNVQVDYGSTEAASFDGSRQSRWRTARVTFPLDPALHAAASYDGIKFRIETAGVFAGVLGIDAVSVQEVGTGVELAQNGSFSAGHRQTATGDHAATFLDRLGGVAFWGSVSHHESAGCAFCLSGMAPLNYFLRGLPLGDAVWFDSWHNSGILYGDPLYSPAAVRLNPVNATDTLSGVVDLTGSTVNGRDPARVSTRYRIDICPGNDFFVCDQQGSWQPTGLAGVGGAENMLLGKWDSASVAPGPYTLRLAVTSQQTTTGRSQTLHDFYPVISLGATGDSDADGIPDNQDNCINQINADQRDSNGDGYGSLCDPDFNDNGIVDPSDASIVKSLLGSTTSPDQDLNGNGIVDPGDLSLFKSYFGQPPGPSCVDLPGGCMTSLSFNEQTVLNTALINDPVIAPLSAPASDPGPIPEPVLTAAAVTETDVAAAISETDPTAAVSEADPAADLIARATPPVSTNTDTGPGNPAPLECAAASGTQTDPSWVINLLSSTDRADPDQLAARASSLNITTVIEEAVINGTHYWRLQVTGFESQSSANECAANVKQLLGIDEVWIFMKQG